MDCCKCPVCGGSGFVDNPFYISTNNIGNKSSNSTAFVTCRTCQGTGIVFDETKYNPHVTCCNITKDLTLRLYIKVQL